jgi:uncharacterized protein YaeQ
MDLSPGLSRPDEPAIAIVDERGRHRQWVEVGNPSRERIERAARASEAVCVYSHRATAQWLRGIRIDDFRPGTAPTVIQVDESFLAALGERLERRNRWALVHSEGLLHVTIGTDSFEASLIHHHRGDLGPEDAT